MGSVTLWMQISLDGFAEGPDDEIHWPVVDEELCESFLDELRQADLFLYGRKTYEIMESFWPTADADPAISQFYIDFARCWKRTPKLVFSRTLRSAGWNTRIVADDLVAEVTALKAGTDGTMVLFGGAETASVFLEHDLIDEYRLFVHPMLLGSGVPLFRSPVDMTGLHLLDVMTFDSAVVQMHYQQADRALC
ncbi:dihydrofolate reductase family protein [Nocardia donostiensis]|uniref:Deaminase n=1 Tax=Nocardia donostiensis TaxID=1538463 RepID=A0A1V2TAZ7_9NOCA|nr:dihydrofolate reductase family protein [Nocardia donostiensis]ONM46521.1 deaminase [Nocardia donostiensis]OQS16698.1 deaminase [Nocardia donostiensis]OQS17525.1 deaminase [Nocardia donostiensis]